jgi:hypothetical protein
VPRGLTGVGVSFHGVAALRGNGVDGEDLVVPWRGDHGVDVELVDNVLRLVPPRCTFRFASFLDPFSLLV